MNLHIAWSVGNYLASWGPVSYTGRTLVHGVSQLVSLFGFYWQTFSKGCQESVCLSNERKEFGGKVWMFIGEISGYFLDRLGKTTKCLRREMIADIFVQIPSWCLPNTSSEHYNFSQISWGVVLGQNLKRYGAQTCCRVQDRQYSAITHPQHIALVWIYNQRCSVHSCTLGTSSDNLIRFDLNSQYRYTRWFKYDRDDLCVNKSQFVPVIFEAPFIIHSNLNTWHTLIWVLVRLS
jgi:hypothetical protein